MRAPLTIDPMRLAALERAKSEALGAVREATDRRNGAYERLGDARAALEAARKSGRPLPRYLLDAVNSSIEDVRRMDAEYEAARELTHSTGQLFERARTYAKGAQ